MDTTHGAEQTEEPIPAGGTDHDVTAVEEMAAMDPADVPDAAERLAADLAADLDAVAPDAPPEQLAAPFTADTDGAS